MQRLFLFVFLWMSVGLSRPAAAQAGAEGLPPRPTPFRFINDAASLLTPADAKKLEGGLRQYADKTGTQVVVVTVPTLGGRAVADYGRALGTAWGVGQRDKNNGVVVIIGAQERKVAIQPGSGLADVLSPEVTKRIISQQMGPQFKQGKYFAGLRSGLNALMLTANPSSDPRKNGNAATGAVAGMVADANGTAGSNLNEGVAAPAMAPEPVAQTPVPAPEPESSGFGMMPLLIGALVIGGGLWFLLRMFRNRSANNAATGAYGPNNGPNNGPGNATPNFLPNRPNGPGGNYGPGQQQGNYGGSNQGQGGGMMSGMGGMGGGMGMGGILATGAAAAAGAYLGNRMASGHDTGSNGLNPEGGQAHSDAGGAAGAGLGAAGTGAGSDYFASRDGGNEAAQPDYFSDTPAADNSSDYFSSGDNSSSDDSSSDDSGGGGFDGDSGSSDSY